MEIVLTTLVILTLAWLVYDRFRMYSEWNTLSARVYTLLVTIPSVDDDMSAEAQISLLIEEIDSISDERDFYKDHYTNPQGDYETWLFEHNVKWYNKENDSSEKV